MVPLTFLPSAHSYSCAARERPLGFNRKLNADLCIRRDVETCWYGQTRHTLCNRGPTGISRSREAGKPRSCTRLLGLPWLCACTEVVSTTIRRTAEDRASH
jgi:hypothetical protein